MVNGVCVWLWDDPWLVLADQDGTAVIVLSSEGRSTSSEGRMKYIAAFSCDEEEPHQVEYQIYEEHA